MGTRFSPDFIKSSMDNITSVVLLLRLGFTYIVSDPKSEDSVLFIYLAMKREGLNMLSQFKTF